MATKVETTIEELMAEFKAATDEHESAHMHAESARSAETAALNRLNRAQKAIDEWHKAIKEKAPWNSDWHQQRRRKASAEAA